MTRLQIETTLAVLGDGGRSALMMRVFSKPIVAFSVVGLVGLGLAAYVYGYRSTLEEDQCLAVLEAIHAAKDAYWEEREHADGERTVLWEDLQPYLPVSGGSDTRAPNGCIYLLRPLCVDPSCIHHGDLLLKRADPIWISGNIDRGLYLDAERWNSDATKSK